MKRTGRSLLWRLMFALCFLLCSLVVHGETAILCNAVTTVGVCVNPGVTDSNGWFQTAPYTAIHMSIQAASATASTAVLEFQDCGGCDPVQFPKSGDPPITNIGNDPNSLTRSFKLLPHTMKVRWRILTNAGTPPINAYVYYEY